jgi:hypothetical protein
MQSGGVAVSMTVTVLSVFSSSCVLGEGKGWSST